MAWILEAVFYSCASKVGTCVKSILAWHARASRQPSHPAWGYKAPPDGSRQFAQRDAVCVAARSSAQGVRKGRIVGDLHADGQAVRSLATHQNRCPREASPKPGV